MDGWQNETSFDMLLQTHTKAYRMLVYRIITTHNNTWLQD